MENKPIIVLVVRPGERPVLEVLDGSLESKQAIVDGRLQQITPFEDDVAILCNDEAKLVGAELNPALFDRDGEMYDIIAGTFIVCYAPSDSESYLSLPEKLIHKYADLFERPESFYRNPVDGSTVRVQDCPVREYLGVNYLFHEHDDATDIEFFIDAENGIDYVDIDWHSVPKGSEEHRDIHKVAKEWAGNLAIDRAKDALHRLETQVSIDERLNDAAERSEGAVADNLTIDILQLKLGDENHLLRFAHLDWLDDGVNSVVCKNYDHVYQYSDEEMVDFNDESAVMDLLERVYTRFNMHHPEDFRGHSLSTSDVVVVNREKAFYCDWIGFKELPAKFVKDFQNSLERAQDREIL